MTARAPDQTRHRALGLLAAAAALVLAGRAAGPDYTRPTVPTGRAFSEAAPADAAPVHDLPRDWWTLFRHPALDALMAEAFKNSPTLAAARHAVRAAEEARLAQQAALWPQVQATESPTRTKIAGNLGGNSPGVQGDGSVISTVSNPPRSAGGTAPFNQPVIYNFHTAQVSISYAPDVFGSLGRQVESSAALAQAQTYEWQAARVTLAANLASAAILDAQLRQQIRSAQAAAQAAQDALRLAERLRQGGYLAGSDEAAQRLALLSLQQAVPPLQQQLEQNRNWMRALIGAPQDRPLPAFELSDFHWPQALPSSLPSQLLEQRPDVRAAEAQLHAAVAQIGVARAARLPQFAITADAGGAASRLSQAFLASGRFFDLTATLTAPLFDAGAARHRELGAAATAAQAEAQYRATVLGALQNVADVLQAMSADDAAWTLAQRGTDTTAQALALAQRRVDAGYQDRSALLAAETAHHQAEQQAAAAQAARLTHLVALYQALGGGWWHDDDPPRAAASQP